MKIIKFITPFILALPVCMVFAYKTWNGDYANLSLSPARSIIFVGMGFTMFIADIFLKYLIGKNKVYLVWIIEVIIVAVLCAMIVPRIKGD